MFGRRQVSVLGDGFQVSLHVGHSAGGQFLAEESNLVIVYDTGLVAPIISDVGSNLGDSLVVLDGALSRHRTVVAFAIHLERSHNAVKQ